MNDVKRLQVVFDEAVSRAKLGHYRYGEFDPERDYRDLFKEAEEELLDALVYLGFMVMKINRIRKKFYEHGDK